MGAYVHPASFCHILYTFVDGRDAGGHFVGSRERFRMGESETESQSYGMRQCMTGRQFSILDHDLQCRLRQTWEIRT
jgi:hypothetical protein